MRILIQHQYNRFNEDSKLLEEIMIDRRSALKVLGAVPVVAATASGVSYAASDDNNVSIDLWMSDSTVGGFFQEPESGPAGSILLIHEWWGLNKQIRSVVTRFAEAGFLALGVDLYEGKTATVPDAARSYMQDVHPDIATENTGFLGRLAA